MKVDHDVAASTPLAAWCWLHVYSLDAVAIGLCWHLVMTNTFCSRDPIWYESVVLGLSIWLIYTLDRLLDSRRLTPQHPHTLRHQVHWIQRRALSAIWCVVAIVDVMLGALMATRGQLVWGSALVAAVVVYVIAVQSSGRWRQWFPKELVAGMVFSSGVSLSAWMQQFPHQGAELLVSTGLAGCLFASNCIAVACWERRLDQHQGFTSWATLHPRSAHWLPLALTIQILMTGILFSVGRVPALVASCLVGGQLLLWAVTRVHRHPVSQRGSDWDLHSVSLPVPTFSLLADAAVLFPPLVWVAVRCVAAMIGMPTQ
ncbi:hypothetical protein NHH03_09260 [Stieleria sp. TO1_6]|uniref:hypothetical protein n=1 Tax=Stieleria tagensis TaxID=2956795 RepID=UPI00209ADEAA|nr:hypothetical protein [Stieleria tagensis]MCO8121923.1 hypothetical protein [Stieleria tagensis]